jgi:hypothetical protein
MIFNISNMVPEVFEADLDRFFMRTEDKYGLSEFNLEKLDFAMSADYEMALIPPILVDKGHLELSFTDLSINIVWRLLLN